MSSGYRAILGLLHNAIHNTQYAIRIIFERKSLLRLSLIIGGDGAPAGSLDRFAIKLEILT